jgi:hypothetical protein
MQQNLWSTFYQLNFSTPTFQNYDMAGTNILVRTIKKILETPTYKASTFILVFSKNHIKILKLLASRGMHTMQLI